MGFLRTIAGRLTLGVGLVSILSASAILLVNHRSMAIVNRELGTVAGERSMARARVVALQLAQHPGEPADAAAVLEKTRKAHKRLHSITVLDRSQKSLVSTGISFPATQFVEKNPALKKGGAHAVGGLVVAVWPIGAATSPAVSGYVVYVESLESQLASSRSAAHWAVALTLVLVVLVIGVAYYIGRQTSRTVHYMAGAAHRIAEGDFSDIDLGVATSSETRRLGAAVHAMARALKGQVVGIQGITGSAGGAALKVASAMQKLAASAVTQAASVNETAASVEEMARTGETATVNAKKIVDAAEATAEASLRGIEAVERTNQIILQIREDAQDISLRSQELLETVREVGDVISSVRNVAEQSKILAVNAAIEAAKAGPYGLGFAVVAKNIKGMALESKEATARITATLITASKAIEHMVEIARQGADRTEEGVDFISNTGSIVHNLGEAMRENSSLANAISTTIGQQSVGLSHISIAVDQITSAAEENQRISARISDEMNHMVETLEELDEIVNEWRIAGSSSA
jgi:methyl-accepting chemotaxis protein